MNKVFIIMNREDMRPELLEILDQAGRNAGDIEVDVWISLSDMINIDPSGIDGFNDLLEDNITFGEICLMDIGYKIIGHKEDSIQFHVTASIEYDEDDSEEEEE